MNYQNMWIFVIPILRIPTRIPLYSQKYKSIQVSEVVMSLSIKNIRLMIPLISIHFIDQTLYGFFYGGKYPSSSILLWCWRCTSAPLWRYLHWSPSIGDTVSSGGIMTLSSTRSARSVPPLGSESWLPGRSDIRCLGNTCCSFVIW